MPEPISELKVPDGGWGWVIVFGSCMISFLTDGFSYTSGVYYEKFLGVYNQSEAVTSIYISVMTGSISLVGPFASGLSQVYGCREVTIVGAVIAVSGILLSVALDYNMYVHAVTLGLFVGCGLGLMFLPQLTIVTEWFHKRLAAATGISVGGSGLGIAAFAYISNTTMNYLDWKWAMMIMAGLMALCIPFALTFREPPHKAALSENLKTEVSFKAALRETINFKVLRNPLFAYFVLVNTVASSVYYVPLIVASDRVKRSQMGDSSHGALLMVYYGLSNFVARAASGFLADLPHVNRTFLYGVAITLMGVVVALTNFAHSFVLMAWAYVGLGVTDGVHATLMSVVLVDEFGVEQLSNTLGIVLLFDGISTMVGPPIANSLASYDPTYASSIWMSAALITFSGVALMLMPLLKGHYERRRLIDKESGAKSG